MVTATTIFPAHLNAGCVLQGKRLRFSTNVSSPRRFNFLTLTEEILIEACLRDGMAPTKYFYSVPLVKKAAREAGNDFTYMPGARSMILSSCRVGFPSRQSPRGARLKVSSEYNCLQVQGLSYRAPGTQHYLLNQVTFSLPEKSLGLVYGRSGSGKTTLLQVLGGLAKPTEGMVFIQKFGLDGQPVSPPEILSAASVGIVFQFPERYFLADTVVEELTFGWPRQLEDQLLRQQLSMRLHEAILAVGLSGIPLNLNPRSLSDGFKRRLALAVQLVRMPDILLLDEPLAGLDWKARADVISLLKNMKKQRILIVVSHDLKEISPLVDKAWRMDMGGFLHEEPLLA